MNTHALILAGHSLSALPSGALWWAEESVLVVSDLHLGKSERMARRGGALLPPYETAETLSRLADDVAATAPDTVICLGDSFDDCAAADALEPAHLDQLAALMAGRVWVWIEGNHDPGPLSLGGVHMRHWPRHGLVLRHIAEGGAGEVSGHYHPKAGLPGRRKRACFLTDGERLILPAYGAYTGGMDAADVVALVGLDCPAQAVLAGPTMVRLPVAGATRSIA